MKRRLPWTGGGLLGAVALLAAAQQPGCAAGAPDETGVVRIAVTTVPADVGCIRITAMTTRTVSQLFDVTPGTSSVLMMSGVPTGFVMFSGDAFGGACSAVGPQAVANWTSDPVTVQVSAAVIADVALVMRRTAAARVGVDFQDDRPTVATTTAVTSSLNPSTFGELVSLTVTVTAANGTIPTGNVTFRDGSTVFAAGELGTSGSTQAGLASLEVGTHVITVEFVGTGPFLGSTSPPLNQVVNAAAMGAHVTLAGAVNFAPSGGQNLVVRDRGVVFTATVLDQANQPAVAGGVVVFRDAAGTELATVPVFVGQASFRTSFAAIGDRSVTARFNGDELFGAATSPPLVFSVIDPTGGGPDCTLPDGAVAWWRADGNFDDAVGNNDGIPTGAIAFVNGVRGGGFGLDHHNPGPWVDAVDSAELDVPTGFTLDAWVRTTAQTGGRIIDKITAFGADGYLLDVLFSHLRLIAGGSTLFAPDILPENNFAHVAGTFDGSRLALYVNGEMITEAVIGGPFPNPVNDLPVRIGADSSGGSQFAGVIDEPRIFNRALTADEIHTLYLQPSVCP